MGSIRGSLTKGLYSHIPRGFGAPTAHLAGEGGNSTPPYYLGARFLLFFFFLFADLPLKQSPLSPLLYILFYFHSVTAPALSHPLGGVVLLLVSIRYGSKVGGSKECASNLTPNMADILATNFFVRHFSSPIFPKCHANTLFWDNLSPTTPNLMLLSSLLSSRLYLLLLSFFMRLISSLLLKSKSNPAPEEDAITVAVVAEGVPSVPTVSIVPP